jgi:hypothetical protein
MTEVGPQDPAATVSLKHNNRVNNQSLAHCLFYRYSYRLLPISLFTLALRFLTARAAPLARQRHTSTNTPHAPFLSATQSPPPQGARGS